MNKCITPTHTHTRSMHTHTHTHTPAGTPRTSLRRRGCGSSGQLAAAPGAANASILPCRRLGRVLLLRCPSLLYACDCLYACDARLEHVHEGPRRNALGRGRSLSSSLFPGRAQACARSLSFLFSPSPLCPVRSDRRDSGPNPGRHPLNPVSPEIKITGKCHECVPVCVCVTVCVSAWIGR